MSYRKIQIIASPRSGSHYLADIIYNYLFDSNIRRYQINEPLEDLERGLRNDISKLQPSIHKTEQLLKLSKLPDVQIVVKNATHYFIQDNIRIYRRLIDADRFLKVMCDYYTIKIYRKNIFNMFVSYLVLLATDAMDKQSQVIFFNNQKHLTISENIFAKACSKRFFDEIDFLIQYPFFDKIVYYEDLSGNTSNDLNLLNIPGYRHFSDNENVFIDSKVPNSRQYITNFNEIEERWYDIINKIEPKNYTIRDKEIEICSTLSH